jgi:hypothetical protein
MFKSQINRIYSLLKIIISNLLILILIFHTSAFGLYADGITIKPVRTTYKANRRKAIPSGFGSSTKLYAKVDDVPVLVEIPGQDDLEKVMKITLNNGTGSSWTVYEYDMGMAEVRLKGPNIEKSYRSYENEDVYIGVVNAMNQIAKKAFQQVGIEYNVENEQLTINEALLLEKSGAGSGYDIEVENLMDRIVVRVRKGDYEVASVYDLSTNVASIQDDVGWGEDLEWNLADGGTIRASGVTTMGIEEDVVRVVQGLLGFINNAVKLVKVTGESLGEFLANAQKKPMERPVDPDITDIVWINREMKSVMVKGTAGYGVRPMIYVTRNGNTYEEGEANSLVESWERLVFLGEGENKINAIVRTPDGREVESGDATVYVGTQEVEPDLILVSPRDRQVFSSKTFQSGKNIIIKGQADPSAKISGPNKSFMTGEDGQFVFQDEVAILREGENHLQIHIENVGANNLTINKTIVGAYEFYNKNRDKSYILRRGDFLFSDKTHFTKIGITFPFDLIPLEPDHVGIYVGNRQVLDAIYPFLKNHDLFKENSDNYYYAEDFYYATQVPKLVNESSRVEVAQKAAAQADIKEYDSPFISSGSILGHFNGSDDGFYCSEVSYWTWEKFSGIDFGVNLINTFYPFRGMNISWNSILPAYFCEETMKVKEFKNE